MVKTLVSLASCPPPGPSLYIAKQASRYIAQSRYLKEQPRQFHGNQCPAREIVSLRPMPDQQLIVCVVVTINTIIIVMAWSLLMRKNEMPVDGRVCLHPRLLKDYI